MIVKRRGSKENSVLVTFALPAAIWADRVDLVGGFGQGEAQSWPMRRSEDGWQTTIECEQGRRFHFRYLADGVNWFNDWGGDSFAVGRQGAYVSVVET